MKPSAPTWRNSLKTANELMSNAMAQHCITDQVPNRAAVPLSLEASAEVIKVLSATPEHSAAVIHGLKVVSLPAGGHVEEYTIEGAALVIWPAILVGERGLSPEELNGVRPASLVIRATGDGYPAVWRLG